MPQDPPSQREGLDWVELEADKDTRGWKIVRAIYGQHGWKVPNLFQSSLLADVIGALKNGSEEH
jgi:hypothetical protein